MPTSAETEKSLDTFSRKDLRKCDPAQVLHDSHGFAPFSTARTAYRVHTVRAGSAVGPTRRALSCTHSRSVRSAEEPPGPPAFRDRPQQRLPLLPAPAPGGPDRVS